MADRARSSSNRIYEELPMRFSWRILVSLLGSASLTVTADDMLVQRPRA